MIIIQNKLILKEGVEMKFKTLRNKTSKEFVQLHKFNDKYLEFTSHIPLLLPLSASIEGLKNVHMQESSSEKTLFVDYDNYEVVELDVFDSGEVGADIRNKLGSPTNLLAILKLYFNEEDADRIRRLEKFIKKEMEVSEISLKYIAELL